MASRKKPPAAEPQAVDGAMRSWVFSTLKRLGLSAVNIIFL